MDKGPTETKTRDRPADQWTRNAFTMRRMTWGNIWAILGCLAVAVIIVTAWMAS